MQPLQLNDASIHLIPFVSWFKMSFCATVIAQSTSQYYFVLQNLHKVLPSTTSHYKACTKYFPVLLRTTKLAQSTCQYDFVPQSLHKVFSSTTSYYKACTNTSQYYFILQSLHKVLPSTTSYYKACTKYFPVLLRTTKLAQSTCQYDFVPHSLHKVFKGLRLTAGRRPKKGRRKYVEPRSVCG